jgi:hypothetical protein
MISSCIPASSVTSRLSLPASLVLCCLAGSHSVAQRLKPMYIPGQFCLKGSDGGLVCFAEKPNYALPAFSLGCLNGVSVEIEVDGKQKQFCLPILPRVEGPPGDRSEIDARAFEDQRAMTTYDAELKNSAADSKSSADPSVSGGPF